MAQTVQDGYLREDPPTADDAVGALVVSGGGGGGGGGDASAANQTTELARLGILTEAAPATDTASSGLNGRLQRIAQRLTSLIALLPTSLGTKTAANSLAVTLSSDQAALPAPADPFGASADAIVAAGAAGSQSAKLRRVTQGLEDLKTLVVLAAGTNAIGKLAANAGVNIGTVDTATLPNVSTATVTQVASSAANVANFVASNAARKGLTVFNDSTASLFIKFGATASATSFTVKVAAGGYWEMQPSVVYTGRIDAIWSAANGNAYTTEL